MKYVHVIPARATDVCKLFALRNDPHIVAHSASKREVTLKEHIAWYTKCMAAPDRHRIFFIAVNHDTVGVVRFDRTEDQAARISIYLAGDATGKGIGTKSIQWGARWISREWAINKIEAHIKAGNHRSVSAFSKAGFVPIGEPSPADQIWRFEFRPPQPRGRPRHI